VRQADPEHEPTAGRRLGGEGGGRHRLGMAGPGGHDRCAERDLRRAVGGDRKCTDGVEQRWALRGEIRDARADLCLRGGDTDGTKLALAACDGTAAQQFTLWSR